MRTSVRLTALLLLAAGCGGKSEPATESPVPAAEEPAPPAAEEPAPPPEGMAFDDMSHEQRIAFMKETVVPTMKPLFQEYDAKRYGEFNCKTCHGAGAADGSFKMPTPPCRSCPARRTGSRPSPRTRRTRRA